MVLRSCLRNVVCQTRRRRENSRLSETDMAAFNMRVYIYKLMPLFIKGGLKKGVFVWEAPVVDRPGLVCDCCR